jgi:hypothetical protein
MQFSPYIGNRTILRQVLAGILLSELSERLGIQFYIMATEPWF